MIDDYLASFDWSFSTRKKYRGILSVFLAHNSDPEYMTPGDLLSWLEGRSTWGNSQRCAALSCVRGYLRWRYGANHPALVAKIKRVSPPLQRSLDGEQVFKLLSCFDTSTVKGRRDLAMCALMIDTGLRVSEVARLDLKYLNLEQGKLQVIVKGGSWESGVYSAYTASLIFGWLPDRAEIIAPGESAVFVGTHKRKGHRLTPGGIGKIVKKWGEVSGVGALSPHDLRRSFATLSTRRGAPTRVLMAAGRWRSSEMVYRYTRAITQEDFKGYFPVDGIMGL